MIFYYEKHLGKWCPRTARDQTAMGNLGTKPPRTKPVELRDTQEAMSLKLLSRLYPAPPDPVVSREAVAIE